MKLLQLYFREKATGEIGSVKFKILWAEFIINLGRHQTLRTLKSNMSKKFNSIQEKRNPTCLTVEWARELMLHSTVKSFCIIY